MKRLLLFTVISLMSLYPLAAQRLVVGDRAPEIKGKWLSATPDLNNQPVMVEFFHSSSGPSVGRLAQLDKLARESRGAITVVVVTRENSPEVINRLTSSRPAYYSLLDSGETFPAYKVQFVPYSVIYNRKGRIVWLGNPSSLSKDEIMQFIK